MTKKAKGTKKANTTANNAAPAGTAAAKPRSRRVGTRPSALVDARIVYCGDCPHPTEPRLSGSGALPAIEDRQASTQAYIDYRRPRCVELSRVLKKTGGTRGRIAGLRRLSPAYVTLP